MCVYAFAYERSPISFLSICHSIFLSLNLYTVMHFLSIYLSICSGQRREIGTFTRRRLISSHRNTHLYQHLSFSIHAQYLIPLYLIWASMFVIVCSSLRHCLFTKCINNARIWRDLRLNCYQFTSCHSQFSLSYVSVVCSPLQESLIWQHETSDIEHYHKRRKNVHISVCVCVCVRERERERERKRERKREWVSMCVCVCVWKREID